MLTDIKSTKVGSNVGVMGGDKEFRLAKQLSMPVSSQLEVCCKLKLSSIEAEDLETSTLLLFMHLGNF